MKLSQLLLAVVLLGLVKSTQAEIATFEPSKDTSIYAELPGNSNALGNIFAGNNAMSIAATRRGLIAFDLSSIPVDSTITSVSLRLFLIQENTRKPPLPVTLQKLLADWGEGTSFGTGSGSAATTGDATWNSSVFGSLAWTTPGGDSDPLVSAVTDVGPENSFYTWSSPGMVLDAQEWLDAPATNFGWILRSEESAPQTAKAFASGENATLSRRPILTVEYTPVPEPSTVGVFAVTLAGAIIAFRRGRKAAN